MTTKKCRTCNKKKPLSSFTIDKSRKDGHGYNCKPCSAVYQRQRYNSNVSVKKQQQELAKKRIRRNKIFIRKYLAIHPCIDCGETDLMVLDFDHVRGKKTADVSQMVGKGRSLEAISNEICKCEIRCANCHRRKTWKQFGWKL